MEWAPPIFSLSSTLANLPPSWPRTSSSAVNLPDRPFYGRSSDLAQLGPSTPTVVGQDWPDAAASVPSTPPPAIGSPNPLFSVASAQSPALTNVPALDPSSSPWGVPPDASTAPAPARSTLFTQQPATLDLGARAPNNLDQSAESLGVSDWPLSKSGTPFLPPPPPSANSPEQMLAALHSVAPNLVDYFTKPLPPPPQFPSSPGKIPAVDHNPYAPGAILDAANLAALAASVAAGGEATPLALARMGEEAAPGATARILSTAGSNPSEIVTGPYGKLSGKLAPGWQAHHINQDSVYSMFIPSRQGFSIGLRGNILTEPGTPHYKFHRSLEQFWERYRKNDSLEQKMPTNAEYGEAVRQALIEAGISSTQASELSAQAAAQRVAMGLSESDFVPRIPRRIWPIRRDQ